MSILIVDDLLDNRISLQMVLETAGYPETMTAGSAAEAFQALGLKDPEKVDRGVDVVLMDVRMPGQDGIEACRQIKADERFRDIPILMVTGQTEEADLERAFAAGASDYLTKPVKIVEMLARLRAALTLKRERDRLKAREQELLEVTRRLEQANRELQRISSLDSLTGIANRREFDLLYQRAWRHALRNGLPLAVIMIDIDFFKAYNDAYGHQQGDECLKQVSSALSASLNRPGDLVARYGGEEFIVLLPETEVQGAVVVAETLQAAVKRLALVHEHSPIAGRVTISQGLAGLVPGTYSSPQSLVAAADQALYQVKRNGRNGVKVAARKGANVALRV